MTTVRTERAFRASTSVVVLVALVLGLAAVGAAASPQVTPEASDVEASDRLPDGLATTLATEATAPFWIRFGTRADLSEAARIADWDERGRAVAATLRDVAADSQAEVAAVLEEAGHDFDAYWVTNAILVHDGGLDLAHEILEHREVEGLFEPSEYELVAPTPAEEQALTSDVEWGIANINADQVWEQYDVRGAGITVANIDTGVQYDHPALVGQYRGNLGDGTFDHDYNWFDAAGTCDGAPCDTNGHGTHTMGTMVGDDGGANRIGVAPDVTWIATNGCCPTDAALIASGQWLLEPTDLDGHNPDASKRPHIINNSWGSSIPSNDPFMEDVTLAWAASGIFGVWSNGNLGPACATSGSPGSLVSNYSIGAYDIDDQIAYFSSRGAGQDGTIKPDLAAPGVNVRSSVPGNGYTTASGTSMAAPHASGAVALLWAAAPILVGDIEQTRALLGQSAIDTPDDSCGGTAERNNVYGEGRLDALALLDTAQLEGTGTLALTVVDRSSDEPIRDASVEVSGLVGRERRTGPDGTLTLPLPPDEYTVTVSAFGYEGATTELTVDLGETTSHTFALVPMETVTVEGAITDGSGQGWPLYAEVRIDGTPDVRTHTNPTDGRYRLTLPVDAEYSLRVSPVYDGYETIRDEIAVDDSDVIHDVVAPVDAERCEAVGYDYGYDGMTESFDDGEPTGWTVVDHLGTGNGWRFDDPFDRGNLTGGDGGFAIAQSPGGVGGELDSSLITPVVDLTDHAAPILRFRQDFLRLRDIAVVQLSTDGGDTWETLLEQSSNARGPREEIIPIPQAAGEPQVQVRFRLFESTFVSRFWQIDDVFIGTRTCDPLPGGLLVGHVRDRNTGQGVDGATVVSDDRGEDATTSRATPADPALDDGFYWLFSSRSGRHWFTADAPIYREHRRNPHVQPNDVVEQDFRLPAGRLRIEPGTLETTVRAGRSGHVRFTVSNTGSAPVRMELRERDGNHPIPRADEMASTATETPVVRVPGEFSPLADGVDGVSETKGDPVEHLPAGTSARPWVDLADYPIHVMDNAVAEIDGRIYSVAGRDASQVLTEGYVYDPADDAWSPIADLPVRRQAASGAAIDGRFYVAGGWGVGSPEGQGTRTLHIYDPATDEWSQGADAPFIFAAAGRAVLDDQLYIVGGCTNSCTLNRVHRYDPQTDTWDELPNYPVAASHLACAGIDDQVYCTGGTRAIGIVWNRTYAFDPATETWTRKADLPIQLWGMSYTASSDRLVVSGGVTGGAMDTGVGAPTLPTELTNEGFSYEPADDEWTPVPPSNHLSYRAGSTCGLAKVGGTSAIGFLPVDRVELLPTYADCVPADVPWLSLGTTTATIEPGRQLNVRIDLDATELDVGTYDAGVWIKEDTPYLTYPVDVMMHVVEQTGPPRP